MKLIKRTSYLEQLKSTIGTPDIKVITGIRRSGKSKLMEAFVKDIENSNPTANIVHINFNSSAYETLKEYHALLYYVETRFRNNSDNFLFIDEVQLCTGFEKAVNSLHSQEKWDIYITGSNAFLMSSDLATLFTGRTFEIQIFPFSFKEYCMYYDSNDDIHTKFQNYVFDGGMSGSYNYEDKKQKSNYIKQIFNTLIMRDIIQRNKITQIGSLEKITEYLIDVSTSETSTRNIANYLESNKLPISHTTVSDYLSFLCNAFMFYKIRRYNVSGKKYLLGHEKYYLADHGFRYAILGTKNINYGKTFENIVAVELLRRGYEVYTGVLYNREIDFVAIKQEEKIYIQVSDSITDPETFQREVQPLLHIKDAYPKVVLTNISMPDYQYEGIAIKDLAHWLLEDEKF